MIEQQLERIAVALERIVGAGQAAPTLPAAVVTNDPPKRAVKRHRTPEPPPVGTVVETPPSAVPTTVAGTETVATKPIDAVRKELYAVASAQGADAAKKILVDVGGATTLSTVSPDRYPALLAACAAALTAKPTAPVATDPFK